jgi:hypothetical protein
LSSSPGSRLRPQRFERIGRHKPAPAPASQQSLAMSIQSTGRIDRRRDRIQEIQPSASATKIAGVCVASSSTPFRSGLTVAVPQKALIE